MGKYDDIINLPRPKSERPAMPVADRAKIFQPFAALKGHEELIKEQQKVLVGRKILSEERWEELNILLEKIQCCLENGEKPRLAVTHFVTDEKASRERGKEFGNYVETIGFIRKINKIEGVLWIGEHAIVIKDICDIIE